MAGNENKKAEAIVNDEAQLKRVKDEFKDGWYGANLQTDGTAIIDQGVGKQVVIREFLFKLNPDIEVEKIDRQTLFNAHAKQITVVLWGDGLCPLKNNPPRVIIDAVKGFYKIYVPCEARLGTIFVDKTKNLTEELSKSVKIKEN